MKPRIFMLADVVGWAWWHKAHHIASRLSDEFDFTIKPEVELVQRPQASEYDLFMAFGITQLHYFRQIPKDKKIIGVTAVRPTHQIKKPCLEVCAVHTNSLINYNQVKQFHPQVYYCPNGVDEVLFAPPKARKPGPTRFSYVGKYVPEKNLDTIIRPACKMVGAKLIAHTKDYRDADTPEQMVEHYHSIDVHIAASTIDGTPNPCLEAAACGRPVISNRIGNMPEFISHGVNGFLVELKVRAYAEKIEHFVKYPWNAWHMGRNARAIVSKAWTWDKQVGTYRRMFRRLV